MSAPQDRDAPIVIELDSADAPSPADAPLIAETAAPSGRAMQTFATLAGRRRSRLVNWFWRLGLALILFVASVAAYDFVTGLVARSPILGAAALGILAVFILVCLALIVRELAALARLRRV
ncbi:MAG: TIGR01620 family protein, partial [Pseudomonadota bacterium]